MAMVCERILANIHTQFVTCLGFTPQKRQLIFGFKGLIKLLSKKLLLSFVDYNIILKIFADGELMAFEPEKGNITHFKHIHRGAISAIQYWYLSNLKFFVHVLY